MRRLLLKLVLFLSIAGYSSLGYSFQQTMRVSLREAVAYAVEHSPRLQAARAAIDIATNRRLQVLVPGKPEFSIEYEGIPDGRYFDVYESRKLILQQRFEFPFVYITQARLQGYRIEQTRQEYALERLNLITEVKTAYIDAVCAQQEYRYAVQNRDISAALLEKTKNRFGAGEEGKQEYLWSKLQQERAENAVSAARAAYSEAQEHLAALLAGKTESQRFTVEPIDTLAYLPVDSAAIQNIESVLSGHPALQIHQSRRDAASSGISLAKQSYLPEVSAAYYKQNLQNKPGFWGVDIGFSLPLWFFSDQRGKKAEAQAELRAAEWQQTLEENRLRAEYRAALASLKESELQVKRLLTEILPDAQELFTLTETLYREGEISYIAVMLAQQSLIETRIEYIKTVAEYNKTIFRLEQVLGKEIQ